MLRYAITGIHHPPRFHRQCLSHLLFRPPRDPFQNPTPCRSFSVLAKEEESRLGGPLQQNPSDPSSTPVEAEDEIFSAPPKGEKNTSGAPAPVDAKPAQASSSSPTHTTTHPRTRTRPRALRPLLIPPMFPPTLLPIFEPPHSHEQATETDSSSTSTMTITIASLPPNTNKADIRPIFQRFGEIERILVHPGGRRADVVYVDAEGVRRALHAYAEQPLHVRGRIIDVFRKQEDKESGANGDTWRGSNRSRTSSYTPRTGQGRDNDDGAIFVSSFPSDTTQEELAEALGTFGRFDRLVMRPDSKYAFLVYSNKDVVEQIMRMHERIPITLRGRNLRIERSHNRPYSLSPGPSGHALELGTPLDPEKSSAILEELKRTVPRWRGTHGPSRVLWIGRLPNDISQAALTNFWSRLGCVVEVRPTPGGFAHVEFASTEEALRAVRQGAPHGFRYADRILDVDFARWYLHIGPAYRVVYVSDWNPSYGRNALFQWAYDIPKVIGARVLPPFRGEDRSALRSAFLEFGGIDDARTAIRMLDGRAGPGGETLNVGLSRLPAVHTDRRWEWAYDEQEKEKRGEEEEGGEEAGLEDEWEGLGFGTGKEDESAQDVGYGVRGDAIGTRSMSWRRRRGRGTEDRFVTGFR